jgi:Fe-Mn family superoxide dismutase
MKKNEVAELIKNTLEIESTEENESLNEALVAQTKTYSIPTEALSQANKKNHYELYEQYVKDFNRISAELDAVSRANASGNHSLFRSLKIDETYNLNAVYLHELYFANIGDLQSEITMDTLAYMRLERDFGSFDDWQRDFLACASASRCGWVVTGYNIFTQTYMNYVIDLHSLNVPVGVIPVVVMDVWQHAYYKDYLKDVSEYTQNMMRELNWNVIESRFERAEKAAQALK